MRLLRRAPVFRLRLDLRVYAPDGPAPDGAEVLARLLRENPFGGARNPVGTGEAMLLSDVRLRVGWVARAKNPYLFEGRTGDRFVRLRYEADFAEPDRRALRLFPYLAWAYGSLIGGLTVEDPGSETVLTFAEWTDRLRRTPEGDAPEHHLRTVPGERIEVRGLDRLGLPLLRSEPVPGDLSTAASAVMAEVGERAYRDWRTPERVETELFDDRYVATVIAGRGGREAVARILRERLP